MNVKEEINNIQQREIATILSSIRQQGLKPLKQLTMTEVIPLSTLQIQSINNNICVNYININDCTEQSIEQTIKLAVYEEYCGIHGISLERTWPLQFIQNKKILLAELSARLVNSLVFILEPPCKYPITTIPMGGKVKTPLAHYEFRKDDPQNNDGFFQNNNSELLNSKSNISSNSITEIKTTHAFNNQSIMAILAPEHLYEQVKTLYKGTKTEIICVEIGKLALRKLPEILAYMHNEKISSPCEVDAPNFYPHLLNICNRFKEFSIHTTRLPTPFDFSLRVINSPYNHEKFIKTIRAAFLDLPTQTPWAVVSKMYAFSKTHPISSMATKFSMPEKIQLLLLANQPYEECFQQLKLAKGAKILTHLFHKQPLEKTQINYLKRNQVEVIEFGENCYAFNYDPNKKDLVSKVINNWDVIENKAATLIQSNFRGFWVHKKFQFYLEKKKEVQRHSLALNKAEGELLNALTTLRTLQ